MQGMTVVGAALAIAAALNAQTIRLQVETSPTRRASNDCAFLISARLVSGGTQTTCITSLDGVPGPGVVMHSTGLMTFHLGKGSIKASVRIIQRFGSDGVHAHQTVQGSILVGTRAYRGAHGSISGRGTVTDRASGLGPVNLGYTLQLFP